MKNILYIGILLFLLNCKNQYNQNSQEVVYYPSKEIFEEDTLKKVDIGTNDDYLNIVRKVDQIHLTDSIPFVEFEEGKRIIRLIPFRNYGFYRERNRIRITEDSTYLALKGYPNTELDRLLKIHFENNNRDPMLSESPQKAGVEIVLDHFDHGEKLLKLLKMVTRSFDHLNAQHGDSLKLQVVFGLPAPPPPPSSPSKKN